MYLPRSHPHPLMLPWALMLMPLGYALGLAYFAALRRGIGCLLRGRPGALPLLLLRLAGALLLLAAAAHWGAPALLCVFGGFLLARQRALQTSGRAAEVTRARGAS